MEQLENRRTAETVCFTFVLSLLLVYPIIRISDKIGHTISQTGIGF